MSTKLRIRTYGLVGLALIALLISVLLGMYRKAFDSYVHITVSSDRTGLLLDRGAAVRAFGLPVGEVRGAKLVGDHVEIDAVIESDQAKFISADSEAEIKATTVFGAKFVALQVPRGPVVRAIRNGQVLHSNGVAVEGNDVFQNALNVIEAVDPVALNATLTSMAQAFQGRGERLGQVLERSNQYLLTFNRHLPQMESDIESAAEVSRLYAEVVPEFLSVADHASTTSKTFRKKQSQFRDALDEFTLASDVVEHLLDVSEEPLEGAVRPMRPVLRLGAEFAPGLTCIVRGMEQIVHDIAMPLGNQKPGIQGLVSLLPSQDPYRYPQNLPQLIQGVGPTCRPLPSDEVPRQPRTVFPDGSQGLYRSGKGIELRNPIEVHNQAFEDWFGTAFPGLLGGQQ